MDLRVTAADLHAGMRLTGERATALSKALKECAANITIMPAHYTTHPNGGPVFRAERARTTARELDIVIDEPFLRTFGTFRVPSISGAPCSDLPSGSSPRWKPSGNG